MLIIAEAGVNHNGSVESAKKLIDVAKEAVVTMLVDKVEYQKESMFFLALYFFSSRRDDWISHMKSLGIDARPSIAHQLYKYFDLKNKDFPNSVRVNNDLVSLPIYTRLTEEEVKRIINAIKSFR